MFKRKIKLQLTQEEWRFILQILIEYRNKLIAENRSTDFVNEVIIKFSK